MTLAQLLYLAQLEDYNISRIEAWLAQNSVDQWWKKASISVDSEGSILVAYK